MNDPNRSMNEVPALLEERRRYEAWLVALDARRDTTPAHVFERVQADYRSRLEQVAERLATHRHAIEEERASVQSRLSLLGAEEQMRRDERAELDLRAHVGELSGDDAKSAFIAVDDSIQQLVGEKASLQGRVNELDALIAERPPVADVVVPKPPPAAPAPPAPAVEAPLPDLSAETPPSPLERPSTPGGSFDELAFLDTVVGKQPAPEKAPAPAPAPAPIAASSYERIITRDEPDSESLLAGLGNAQRRPAEEGPLAANVPANTPIVLRSSGAIEQSKTLKCNECGAMNYPTEWYCERCGAELAAL